MPLDGELQSMVYIPGDLFSVNPLTAQMYPNLFARNERVVCVFKRLMAQWLGIGGATIVANIETVWSGRQLHHQQEKW